nr:MAG TPA: repressor domain protein [Caudoviricetes sp.]
MSEACGAPKGAQFRKTVRQPASPRSPSWRMARGFSKLLRRLHMSIPACFSFENSQVRTLGTPDLPLFVAIDVASALGFQKPSNAVSQHVDSEDLIKQEITDKLGRAQTVNCVNESGLYALIFGSKLESAKRFKRWVTSEVLPAIRKTGRYEAQETITPAEQRAIQREVAIRAHKTSSNYRTIYRAIKARYQIARYDQLPRTQLEDCLDFIREVELDVPEVPHTTRPNDGGCPHCGLHPIPAGSIVLSAHEAENLRTFVYYWRYLFREDLETVLKLMRLLQSPFAPRFYEAVTSMNIGSIEALLERNGYSVKQLSCYRALTAS